MASTGTIGQVNMKVNNANELAERMSAIAVLGAKIGALCEDVAKELRSLASMGGNDADSAENAPATNKSIGTSDTESMA